MGLWFSAGVSHVGLHWIWHYYASQPSSIEDIIHTLLIPDYINLDGISKVTRKR